MRRRPDNHARWRTSHRTDALRRVLGLAALLLGLPCRADAGAGSPAGKPLPVLSQADLLAFGKSWNTPPLPKYQWLPNSQGLWHLAEGWLEVRNLFTDESQRVARAVLASFAPDSTRVALVQTNNGISELCVADLGDRSLRRLGPVERQGFELRWHSTSPRFHACWIAGGTIVVVSWNGMGSTCRRIAEIPFTGPEPTVVWSRDGSQLAFITEEIDARKLWVVSGGAEATPVCFLLEPTWDKALPPVWSPDDRKIAVVGYRITVPTVNPILPTAAGSTAKVSGGVEDRCQFVSILWTYAADGSGERQELSVDHIVQHLRWSADGAEFTYVARFQAEENFTSMGPMEIRHMDRRTGRQRTLLRDRGFGDSSFDGAFDLSPNGRTMAVIVRPYDGFYVPRRDLIFLDLDSGQTTAVRENLPIWGGTFVWSADGATLFLGSRGDAAYRHIYAVSNRGRATRLTRGLRNHGSPQFSPDRTRFFCVTEDQLGKRDIRCFRTDGSDENVLHDGTPLMTQRYAKGEVSEVTWLSRDRTRCWGTVIQPPGHRTGDRRPLLVILHGGPASGIHLQGPVLFNTPLEKHFWAGRGYVVFSPEFRSSGLLGRSSVEKYLRRQDMFARDQDDVVSGVDHLVRLGLADRNRVAVTGHSWGAYVVNWLITHSDRFQVAVSFEGESDYTLAYGTDSSLGGNTYWEGLFQGKPWETPGNYLKNSPAHSIRRVKIPTLFASGAKGAALFHNQYLHTVLRQHGVDTQLVVYEGEGHSVDQPANQRDLLSRTVDWIDSNLRKAP